MLKLHGGVELSGWATYHSGILAHQVGEVGAQLLNGRNGAEHRLSSRGQLQNSLVTLVEESSVLILDVDDRSRASLIDRGSNEDHRQQSSVATTSSHGQIELGHFCAFGYCTEEVYDSTNYLEGQSLSQSGVGGIILRSRELSGRKQ